MAKTFESGIMAGDRVVSSSGRQIGKVRAVRGEQIYLGRLHTWVPRTAIRVRGERALQLYPTYDYLAGPKKSMLRPSRFVIGLVIAGVVLVFRDQQRRGAVFDAIGGWMGKAKRRLRGEQGRMWSAPEVVQPGEEVSWRAEHRGQAAETMPFSSLDLSERRVTDLERDVVALVTRAFPDRDLRIDAVAVHKLEGGEVGTLRFTLDGMASSDVELARLEKPIESADKMAYEVVRDLRDQLAGVRPQQR